MVCLSSVTPIAGQEVSVSEDICIECGEPIAGLPSARRADGPVHDVCAIGPSDTAHRPPDYEDDERDEWDEWDEE